MESVILDVLSRIAVENGDITQQRVDAVVNAANSSLLGGGGVDGAIHKAAGPELYEECKALKGCATGEAKITRGYQLPAKWVIHTVGPIWKNGERGEEGKLADCYRNCLLLARQHEVRAIAFPAISTGAYGFPLDRAATIAATEIGRFLQNNHQPEKVILVCFGDRAYKAFSEAVSRLAMAS